ncbi:YadA-like family protein [Morganella morganii subsp. morganii]|nr:YadA-like family protein [Morganella morganii]MBT0337900.1 YadA-like family protein [Morganella morganii subsp. morganii]
MRSYIIENNESAGELHKEITLNQRLAMDDTGKLDDKITLVSDLVKKTDQKINEFMVDITENKLPEYTENIFPELVKNEVGSHMTVVLENNIKPLEERTGTLESKTQQLDTQLDITTRKARHNNELLGTIPEMIRQEIAKEAEEHGAYVDSRVNKLADIVFQNQLHLQNEQNSSESMTAVTQELAATATEMKKNIGSLESRIEFNEEMAIKANYEADANEINITENSKQIGAHTTDILENQQLLASAQVVTSVIADATLALEADVAKMDTRISNASRKAGTATNVANQNTRNIAEQKVKVEKNTLDILKNRQDLRSLENDLRETNERLDNGLAASAALNGLFQPYGVGKLNITAAMGGYQSTQAVAVGTGYRFNENIAVKTGVAYTGSNDVMYNMAFNLEW